MTRVKDAESTRRDFRELFAKWGLVQYTIVRDQEEYTSGVLKRGDGVTVRYLRKTGWQTVYANKYTFTENLRNIHNFLDRIRIAEKEGVAYQALSSTKDLVKTTVDTKADEAEDLADAYDVLGVKPTDPLDLIDRVYKAKAQTYHTDVGGNDQAMKRLNAAHDLVLKSRGGK
jgi:hypothetical protein